MNQLVYNEMLVENSTMYLSSIKRINKTKAKVEFKQYRKNSLYYLVKLNFKKHKSTPLSIEYKIFSFIEENLDDILVGTVLKLVDIKEKFDELILTHFDYKKNIVDFYGLQIPIKDIKISPYEFSINFFDNEDIIQPKLRKIKDILQEFLFKYKLLDQNQKKLIISSVKNKLCPYCSRNYINLIEGITHNMGINLDHYYSQKDYPLFAISFFNLIPSCQPCNSAFKGGEELDDNYIHPNKDSLDSAKFILKLLHKKERFNVLYFLDDNSFEIDYTRNIKANFKEVDYSKFNESAKFFKIKTIYNAHKDIVQRTLIDYYVYQEGEVLDSIQKTFPMLNLQHKTLGIGISKEESFYLPFGKLKYDVLFTLLDKRVNKDTNYNDVF